MSLHGVDGERELIGDLAVRRGNGVCRTVPIRPAQREEHPLLHPGELDRWLAQGRDERGGSFCRERSEDQRGLPDLNPVAAREAPAAMDPLAVDVCPVRGQAVVADCPALTKALELGMDP